MKNPSFLAKNSLVFLTFFLSTSLFSQTLTITGTGQTGTSGTNWSLTGNTITITGNADINASVINGHLSSNSLTVTGASTITVSSAITWSTNQTLTLKATGNITINTTISASASFAGLNIYYGGSDASTAATAGTSYSIVQSNRSKIQLSGNSPILKIANETFTVYNSLAALTTAMNAATSSTRAAISTDLSLTQTYSKSLFDITFTGVFDGLGNTIDGLTIRNSGGASTKQNLGLFSQFQGATVRNLGITNIDIITSSTAAGSTGTEYRIGGLVGNVGDASLSSGYSGSAYTSRIEAVWSSGNISTANNYVTDDASNGDRQKFFFGGGIVGSQNNGTLNMTRCYSTANVSTAGTYTNNLAIGGLVGDVGLNTLLPSPHTTTTSTSIIFSLSKSYTTGSVLSGTYGAYYGTGGLVGVIFSTGSTISDCYSWGSAVSTGSFGGLIGYCHGGTLSEIYTTQSTGGSIYASTQNLHTHVTGTSPSSGTTLPSGFSSLTWSKANNEKPLLIDLEASPTPFYIKVTTGQSSNFGNINVPYTITDASGNAVTLSAYSLATPTGTAVFTINNISPAGTYSNVSYISGLILTGSNASLYTLKPFPTSSPASHTIICPSGTCLNYTITYNGNSNTSGSAPSTQTFSSSATVSDKGTLARFGYTFTGWNTAANGSGTNYAVASSYSSAANVTLYAQWRKVPYTVCSFSELTTAISSATDGDTISINCNIIATAETTVSKTLVFEGNGYTIQVPVTGLNDMGEFNSSASSFRVFTFNGSSKTVTINSWTIKGGAVVGYGGAIYIAASTTVKVNSSTLSNSRAGLTYACCTAGGGAVNNNGVLYMYNSFLKRNCAQFGGAVLNDGGTTFIESSTMVENRTTSSSGGGGAVENKNGGTMYFNNSTLSNNQSEIVGGAINVYGGIVYFINSSATGNVVYGGTASNCKGGAISNNGGTIYIINSLLAYNYRRNSGTSASPTGFTLDDIEPYSNASNVHILHSIYHATMPTGVGTNTGNVQYTGLLDGSDNSIFSGGISSKITDYQGLEIGTATVFRPYLYSRSGSSAPTLKSGSFIAQSGNKGKRTRFANNNNVNPVVAYWNGSSYTNLTGTSSAGQEVLIDQKGDARPDPPSRGALESYVENLYSVKITSVTGGSVTGGSTYGEIYPSGTTVVLTATPATGYYFVRWDWVTGGTGTASTSNPYSFTLTQSVVLTPVFAALGGSEFSITYAGNGHTSGSLPTGGRFSTAQTIANAGSLDRDGYVFNGWNSKSTGDGTSYTPGQSYSTVGTSLVLFAQWSEISWTGETSNARALASNWSTNQIPSTGSSFSISPTATRNLVLNASITPARITFRGGNKQIETGNYDITTSSIENANANNFIKTTGTGRLKMNISTGASTLFPVGKTAYNPVTITNKNASADDFSVLVADEVYENGSSGTIISTPRVTRTWNINKTNANSGSGVNFVFNWNSGETSGTITTAKLFHYGTSWQKQTGTTSSTATSLTYTGYTGSFSPFAIGDDIVMLPVQWLSFNCGIVASKGYQLQWTTASESQTRQFIIERSADGKNFTAMGNVPAAGYSQTARSYNFTDASPLTNGAFYRIALEDETGAKEYSSICRVFHNPETGKQPVVIFPNPSQGSVIIQAAEEGEFVLYDVSGKTLKTGKVGGKTTVNAIPVGIYLLKVKTGETTHTEKIIV
ncbi:MAG: hypothetical protein RIT07_1143, partial [Bacteroidota bacterium]